MLENEIIKILGEKAETDCSYAGFYTALLRHKEWDFYHKIYYLYISLLSDCKTEKELCNLMEHGVKTLDKKHKKRRKNMIGAIIGDIIGSRFEYLSNKSKDFSLFDRQCNFTDDSVITIAVAYALSVVKDLNDEKELKKTVIKCMKEICQKYPNCGYGTFFKEWVFEKSEANNSFGNGAAMRVSPVGLFCKTEEEVKRVSRIVTEVSHSHEEAIKGAEAVALSVFWAKQGWHKNYIKERLIAEYYPEIICMSCDSIRVNYSYDTTCQGTVPQALVCFFEASDFEDAIRNAVSLGGDSDTLAAITGGIAEVYYGVPLCVKQKAWMFLDDYLKNCLSTAIKKLWR